MKLGRKNLFTKEQEKQICKEYLSEKKPSTIALGKKWGCSVTPIWNIIEQNGYDLRSNSESRKIFTKEQEVQIIKDYFSEEKPSILDLAKKNNCSNTAIRNVFIRNGRAPRTESEAHKGKNKIFTKKEELQICKEYFLKENPSTDTLAEKWNCCAFTIGYIIRRNGHKVRSQISQALKNCHGTKCYYNNEFFPSLGERNCYIYLIELGYIVIHNFEGRFDFLVIKNNKKIVVEFHPFDFNLTDKQYYNQRRKLLNKYGYKNLKLVVIKDLNEIEHKLIKGV